MEDDSDNDKISVDQYGRKTWNVEAYAKDAKRKPGKKSTSAPTKSNTSFISTDKPSTYLAHRDKLLDQLLSAVGQHTIINPLNTGTYGANKKFGFVCLVCDLSFRDNLALIDHINSPLHVQKSQSLLNKDGDDEGELLDGGVRRATLEEVKVMLRALIAKLVQEKSAKEGGVDIKERIAKREAFEKAQQEKRRARRQKRKTNKKTNVESLGDRSNMASMMGFGGFGTTKK